MSDGGFGEGGPFEGMPMFRDLARLFTGQGPVNWDVSRQIGWWLATDGQTEPNVEPLERIRYEELLRVAEMHVADATGLDTVAGGSVLKVVPVTPGNWTLGNIDAFRPMVEALAEVLASGGPKVAGIEPSLDPGGGGELLGDLGRMLGPVLVGIQAGYMLGHLGRRALGQYDVVVARQPFNELVVVPANVAAAAEEWSLPPQDLAMWTCVREIASHTVLSRPHVQARIIELVSEYVSLFDTDGASFDSAMMTIDPTNPMAFQSMLGNPETLLGVTHSPAQDGARDRLGAVYAAVAGYIDHVMAVVGHGLVGSHDMITEAMNRRRTEPSDGADFARRLFGIGVERRHYDQGQAFVAGVLDRAGDDGLRRLWQSEKELPTPAEIEAPGLWLARIDLTD